MRTQENKEKYKEYDHKYYIKNRRPRTKIGQLELQIAQLKQQLAELKEKDNYHLRYELAGADETITNLKKQLEEKDKEINSLIVDYEKRISQEQELMSNMEQQLAEKDKELIYMTKQAKKFNNEAQKYYEDAYCNGLQNQKAIAELEKVKIELKNKICMVKNEEHCYSQRFISWYEMCDQINKQIDTLKGKIRNKK